jgi:DNA-binding NtrC family response regulator
MSQFHLIAFVKWHAERLSLWHNWFERLPDVVRNAGGTKQIPEQLQRWKDDYPRLQHWVRGLTEALSPRQVLQLPSFAAWPPDFRAQTAKWVHEYFLDDYRVGAQSLAELANGLLGALQILDRDVNNFLALQGKKLAPEECKDLAKKIEEVSALRRQVPDRVIWPQPTASPLPEILVIDDLLGRLSLKHKGKPVLEGKAIEELEEMRRAFCQRFRLIDADRKGNVVTKGTVARARFCAGQRWDVEKGFVNDLGDVKKLLGKHRFALILVDVVFNVGRPDTHGQGPENTHFGTENILPWLIKNPPAMPVVVLTSRAAKELIRDVRSRGFQYLHRSGASDIDLVFHLLRSPDVTPTQLRAAMSVPDQFVAEDRRMLRILFRAWKEAKDEEKKLNILILGESGVGKEGLARFIFDSSPRAQGSFVERNCGQFQGNVETANSELFGHAKGSFTTAATGRLGAFRTADGGVLFLDEVGELPLEVQVKLLRVLETGTMLPFGEDTPVNIDVRLIAATNRNLAEMVKAGTFREDLYYRLRKVEIKLPPLRKRRADIVPIAKHCLRMVHPELELDDTAGQFLAELPDLPGNVRHLQEVLNEAAVGMSGPNVLLREDVEAAWRRLQKSRRSKRNGAKKATREPASVPPETVLEPPLRELDQREGTPKEQVAIQDIAEAVGLVLRRAVAPEGWDGLSTAEIRAINEQLDGEINTVIAALVNWSLFCGREKDTPEIARYVTGKDWEHRGPQDVVGRLLKVDGVAEQVREFVNRPGNEKLKQNKILQRLIAKRTREQPDTQDEPQVGAPN